MLLGVGDGDAFVSVETDFVGGREAVDEAVDGVVVFIALGCCWRGGNINHVGIAPVVDDPGVVVQARNAEVFRVWAADGHLVQPEIGAVAEVDCWVGGGGHGGLVLVCDVMLGLWWGDENVGCPERYVECEIV